MRTRLLIANWKMHKTSSEALSYVRDFRKLIMQVHDELVFEVPKKEVFKTISLVKKVMENAAHLDVPLVVDAGSGPTWADAH